MREITLFTPRQGKPFRPTAKDVETLKALNRYFLLTATQVTRLFYAKGSLKWAKDRMKLLAENGYADRLENRSHVREFVYRLGPAGLSLLRTLDEDVPRRLRRYESSASENFVPHTLAINDVLITAELLERARMRYRLLDFVHEKTLSAIKVPVGGGREEGVIPDGIVTFVITEGEDEYEQTFFLEVDMGSEKRARWMRKVRKLITYGKGAYKRHYDTPLFNVAVITPLGERHLHALRKWTADVLAEDNLRGTEWEQVFSFTGHEAATTDPEAFWLSRSWYQPFSDSPTFVMGGAQ